MKTRLIFFLVCMSITGYSQTNIYHPFPDSNAVWNMRTGACCWSSCLQFNDPILLSNVFSRFLNGDTIINNLTYAKMYESGSTHLHCPLSTIPNDWQFFNDNYVGCIRQDTALKQVYLIQPASVNECVLYDFSLNVGDTLPTDCNGASSALIISSIDSILIDGSYRKKFNINCNTWPSNYFIIDGIGSTVGHFEPFYCPLEQTGDLICFSQNGQILWPDTATSCNNMTSVHNPVTDSTIEIYPNPFNSSTTIRVSDLSQINKWILIDTTGRSIRERIIASTEFSIERDDLVPGIYFLQLKSEHNKVITVKLIVQ